MGPYEGHKKKSPRPKKTPYLFWVSEVLEICIHAHTVYFKVFTDSETAIRQEGPRFGSSSWLSGAGAEYLRPRRAPRRLLEMAVTSTSLGSLKNDGKERTPITSVSAGQVLQGLRWDRDGRGNGRSIRLLRGRFLQPELLEPHGFRTWRW